MRIRLNRRTFLNTCLAAGLSRRWASAAAPIPRNGKPYLKLSLAAYSFRDYLTAKVSPMSLDDFIRLCADYDIDGCELTSYYFPKDFDREYLIHLRELTFKLGLDVSGTAIANDFCLPEGEKRQASLAHTRNWIENASLFGAPVIRIFAGNVPEGETDEAAIARCAAGINESLLHASQQGVCLALENHGGITSTAENMLKILDQVTPSPWFGVNLDSGNFFTPDPYADLAKIAPYAINAQLKTEIAPAGQPKRETDLEREIHILKQAGYRGYVVLEYEASEDPRIAIPRHLDQIRKLIAQ